MKDLELALHLTGRVYRLKKRWVVFPMGTISEDDWTAVDLEPWKVKRSRLEALVDARGPKRAALAIMERWLKVFHEKDLEATIIPAMKARISKRLEEIGDGQ